MIYIRLSHSIIYFAAIKFTIEPHNVVVPEGSSVLLPCEGILVETNVDHASMRRKFNKNRLDQLPNIRWRGPDGQDIGIVGDTFRYVVNAYCLIV